MNIGLLENAVAVYDQGQELLDNHELTQAINVYIKGVKGIPAIHGLQDVREVWSHFRHPARDAGRLGQANARHNGSLRRIQPIPPQMPGYCSLKN